MSILFFTERIEAHLANPNNVDRIIEIETHLKTMTTHGIIPGKNI